MHSSNLRHRSSHLCNRIKQTTREGAVIVENIDKFTDKTNKSKPLIIELEPLVRKIGNTTYRVHAISSPNASVDLIEKLRRLILNDNSPE